MKTPIILIGFNRPAKFEALLHKVCQTPFEKAYIFCDGARNEQDEPLCLETQRIAQQFAQRYPIEVVVRNHNYGISKNVIDAISSVLLKHPQAIIFEDDIHPREGCISYLDLALKTYKDREDIFSIGCYHRPLPADLYSDNTFLSPRFNCWGWATWASRWQKVQAVMESGEVPFKYYYDVPEIGGEDHPNRVRHHHLNNYIIQWDIHLVLQCLKHGWWQVQPKDCLIENVGFDGSGMNCGSTVGSECFEMRHQTESYTHLNPHLEPNPAILRAIQATYADPRVTPFRRWRRKWFYRLQMAFK